MTFRHPIAPAVVAVGMAQPAPTSRAFAPRAPLALDPAAFGLEMFFGDAPARAVEMRGDVAVLEIVGPLMHHAEPWCDSYDEIKTRFAEALASPARVVLLSIDSPGGLVAGCFDAVSELRAMAAAAGKPVHAYVDAQTTSAAYAIACAADKIWIPPAGLVGSIGVINAIVDETEADRKAGLNVTLIRSGARKADGNPHEPTTAEAVAEMQATVDSLAEIFFGVVAERRRMSVDAVRALDARIVCGAEAIAAQLADALGTFDQVIAALNAAPAAEPEPVSGEETTARHVALDESSAPIGAQAAEAQAEASPHPEEHHMGKLAEVKAGLQAAIDDEESTPEDREAARRALSALDVKAEDDKEEVKAAEEEEPDPEPDGDEPKGEGEEKDDDEEEKPSESKALALAAQVQALSAWKASTEAKTERASLMAQRPDFAEATVAWLNSQPLATVRSACRTPDKGGLPRGAGKGGQIAAARAAAASAAAPTAGHDAPQAPPPAGPVVGRSNLSGEGERMDRQMGLHTDRAPLEVTGNTVVMRAIKRADAARQNAARNGAK
jgi:signal peptide peptidase SppA